MGSHLACCAQCGMAGVVRWWLADHCKCKGRCFLFFPLLSRSSPPPPLSSYSTWIPATPPLRLLLVHLPTADAPPPPAPVPRLCPVPVPAPRLRPLSIPRLCPVTVPRLRPLTIPRLCPAAVPRVRPLTIPRPCPVAVPRLRPLVRLLLPRQPPLAGGSPSSIWFGPPTIIWSGEKPISQGQSAALSGCSWSAFYWSLVALWPPQRRFPSVLDSMHLFAN